jgi:hypothetical protein
MTSWDSRSSLDRPKSASWGFRNEGRRSARARPAADNSSRAAALLTAGFRAESRSPSSARHRGAGLEFQGFGRRTFGTNPSGAPSSLFSSTLSSFTSPLGGREGLESARQGVCVQLGLRGGLNASVRLTRAGAGRRCWACCHRTRARLHCEARHGPGRLERQMPWGADVRPLGRDEPPAPGPCPARPPWTRLREWRWRRARATDVRTWDVRRQGFWEGKAQRHQPFACGASV